MDVENIQIIKHSRRKFSTEFRESAVRRALFPGTDIAALARELTVGVGLLGTWIKKSRELARENGGAVATQLELVVQPPRNNEDERIQANRMLFAQNEALRKSLKEVEGERDVLKNMLVQYLVQ